MDGFYVAYEYGSGAAWAFVKAESAEEVATEWPEVEVYETPPGWMTVEDLHQVRRYAAVDFESASGVDEVLDASRRLSLEVAS